MHVVPLLVSHHLEGQLVVVSQKERPLTDARNGRRLLHDLHDRMPVFQVQAHEHARHERKVIRHVAFVAVAEIGADVGRKLVGLGEQHPVRPPFIDVAPNRLEDGMGIGKVLAARALALD